MISTTRHYKSDSIREFDVCNDLHPRLIDGLDVIDALTPVSKKTGLRENLLTLLRKVVSDPAKAQLLNVALQELPKESSFNSMSDDDKIDALVMRLNTGSPAEDDLYRSRLSELIPDFNQLLNAGKSKDDVIEFESQDVPDVTETK